MSVVTLSGESSDGRLRKSAASYLAALEATAQVSTGDSMLGVHWSEIGGNYYLDRAYYSFDVSDCKDSVITGAKLTVYNGGGSYNTSFVVHYKDWGTTLTSTDWSSTLGPVACASTVFKTNDNTVLTLSNLSNILSCNGRFEIVHAKEGAAPNDVYSWECPFSENATEGYAPTLELTYGPAVPSRDAVATDVDDSLFQVLAGNDTIGYRDVTAEAGDLVYSHVRPGGPASCTFQLPADVMRRGINEVAADSRVVVRYAGRVVWDGYVLPRGVNYEGE